MYDLKSLIEVIRMGQQLDAQTLTLKIGAYVCKICQSEPVNTNDFGARSTRLEFLNSLRPIMISFQS